MTEKVDQRISNMDEAIAMPRKNGELIFEAPWESRAFGLAVTLNEEGVFPWSDFSQGLAAEIAAAEAAGNSTTYYERWLVTLERLVISHGLISPQELEAMALEQALHDAHEHDHHHHHDERDHEHHHHHYHNGHHHHDVC